jgi:hypothetical protein
MLAQQCSHIGVHTQAFKTTPTGYGQGSFGEKGYAGGPATSASAAAPQSSITVDASAPNCEIEVDGNFMGSTPSTLNLAPGKHEIVVKKTGYQDWSRSMMVGSGAVRLSADMVVK